MTTTTKSYNGLDFDTVKQNLIEYLKSQDQFKDYNFEGSSLNILLDVLAYNTAYQGFYANMVATEMFLDSCKTRESAVSHAKHLNYVPKSVKSAYAYVDIELSGLNATQISSINAGTFFINKEAKFLASDTNGASYTFGTTKIVKVLTDGSKYYCDNVELKEGSFSTITYVADYNDTSQKFRIPSKFVDVDDLVVRVQQSVQDTTGFDVVWERVSDINLVSSDSQVYFLQENEGYYEVYFGDDIVGVKPSNGNLVSIKYRVSTGPYANDLGTNETASAPTFKFVDFPNSTVSLVVDTVTGKPSPTFGGSFSETIADVKYYAPRNFQGQDRAVTAEDYRVLLAKQYGDQAESVFVWGGEDNEPPIYGKVFISIKPKNNTRLTSTEKLSIARNILKAKNLISITPEIVDPDYLYLQISSTVNYNASKTDLTQSQLEELVKSLIAYYGETDLQRFDTNFRVSKFTETVSGLNPSFLSNYTTLKLKKNIEPNVAAIASYNINFDNSLYHPIAGYTPILTSTVFGYQDSTSSATIPPNVDAYLDDNGNGVVRIYKLVNGTKIYLNTNAGTIDYTTGKVTLVNFNPQYLSQSNNNSISLVVVPNQTDIYARRNQILLIDTSATEAVCSPETVRYDPYKSSATSFPFNT